MKKFLRWLDINFEPLYDGYVLSDEWADGSASHSEICIPYRIRMGRRSFAFYFCVAGILIYSLCGAECPTH